MFVRSLRLFTEHLLCDCIYNHWMTDENHDDEVLDPELKVKVLERFKLLKEERGRATVIITAFYDKLAALNAGSIAIAVSVGLTILNKQELRHLSHGLLCLILCFWFSLLTAILHNFLLLRSAKLDAAYASDEFIKNTFEMMFRRVQLVPGTDPKEWKQVKGFAQEEPIRKQRITTARKRRCESAATVVAILSISCFFLGYTLVVIGAWRLWL
jgi:hypothetical protein